MAKVAQHQRLLPVFILTVMMVLANSATATSAHTFPENRVNGSDCTTEAKAQVHQYNDNLFIIRQSVCTNFEAPFIYLLFGKNKVLMQDSGASDFGQRQLVDNIIAKWLGRNKQSTTELIVSHSHGHGDHVAGDSLFTDRPNTQIIGKDLESVKQFFGFENWPEGIVHFDLGERQIDILPIPGHQDSHLPLNMNHLEQLINWLPTAQPPVKKKVFDDFILFPTD